mgnify:CR=1 FL=1|tara:strand:+ start:7792 stop:9210 length:1419 start_codon:yes stop_codon:yes gene_type:complete
MRFFNPSVNFDGVLTMDGTPSAANHLITKSFAEANLVAGIHADSSNYAELVSVGGVKQLKLKPLTITDVSVDTSATSLNNWISANYSNGNEKQEGDIIILTETGTTRPESFIHNGGTAGTAADWTAIQGSDVQASEVRGFLSGGSGITYNSGNGQISADQAAIRGFFSADAGGLLAYDSSNGVFNLTATTVQNQITVSGGLLAKSGGELSLTSGNVRGLFSAGANLAYDSSTGSYSIADSVIRGKISAKSGALISYDNSNGEIDLQASTIQSQITVAGGLLSKSAGQITLASAAVLGEFSGTGLITYDDSNGEIGLTAASVRNQLSVNGSGLLQYNNSTGQFDLTATTVQNQITVAGGLLAKSGGEIALSSSSVRGQISASSPGADTNLLAYNAGVGELSVLLSSFRKQFASQALTANTFATLNHGLGQKLVHVSAMDASGNLVQLEVQYQDTNNVKVKSAVGVTLDIAVSI